jgi:hypothetical protein
MRPAALLARYDDPIHDDDGAPSRLIRKKQDALMHELGEKIEMFVEQIFDSLEFVDVPIPCCNVC